ncbi:hypothetical protein, partial [Plesiomonas shigelloides]|uniref:hypothetical protein n=1 Tax=Plesiomonas shigelloides TaxID=703 RepID=UPI001C46A103
GHKIRVANAHFKMSLLELVVIKNPPLTKQPKYITPNNGLIFYQRHNLHTKFTTSSLRYGKNLSNIVYQAANIALCCNQI